MAGNCIPISAAVKNYFAGVAVSLTLHQKELGSALKLSEMEGTSKNKRKAAA